VVLCIHSYAPLKKIMFLFDAGLPLNHKMTTVNNWIWIHPKRLEPQEKETTRYHDTRVVSGGTPAAHMLYAQRLLKFSNTLFPSAIL
jgi:hypothetical protein